MDRYITAVLGRCVALHSIQSTLPHISVVEDMVQSGKW